MVIEINSSYNNLIFDIKGIFIHRDNYQKLGRYILFNSFE